MIKGITQQGKYMYIHGGSASPPYISPGTSGAGMVRWNSNMNCLEVNDGNSWKTIDMGYATVGLNPEAEMLLDWAKVKMQEEQEMKRLAENHPAVKIALENLNKAQEQLKATVILSKEHQPNEETAS
jgi:hypothetical protein